MKKDYTRAIAQVGKIADLWLPLRMQYAGMPGLAVAVGHKGKLGYTRGFGYADPARKQKISEKTLFRIASISKTFTTVAIMQLAEQKKLQLTDPVVHYVPWFAPKITIEDLLSHSSGIFRDGDTEHWGNGVFPKDLARSFSKEALVFKRGKTFKYSNYGFSVLGLVIEAASGMTYADYIQRHILRPLDMRSTFTDYDKSLPRHATGFERFIPGRSQKAYPHYKTHAYAPATGFSSTAEDLSKFAASLCYGVSPQILSDKSKKKMIEKEWATGTSLKYGFGLDVHMIGKKKVYGHSGGFLGFTLQMLFDPKEQITVVALANSSCTAAAGIALGILELLYRGQALQKRGKPAGYAPYTGTYRDNWRDTVCATLGNSLIAFPANADAPHKSLLTLTSSKKRGDFVVSCTNLYGAPGEKVSFASLKNRRSYTMRTMSGVAKRI